MIQNPSIVSVDGSLRSFQQAAISPHSQAEGTSSCFRVSPTVATYDLVKAFKKAFREARKGCEGGFGG